MSKLNDEILNKYIDNDLDKFEIAEVKDQLENNEEALANLRALRKIDNTLKRLEVESAPSNMTEKIMHALIETSKIVKPKVNYFFVAIVSIFLFGLVAVFTAAFKMGETENGASPAAPKLDQVKDFLEKNIISLQTFFAQQNVLLIVSVLTLLLIISAYFTFESFKNFKNKLNSIVH